MDLTGRVAVVTGGAGHIGFAMCQGLAELGAKIVLIDVNKEALEEKAATLRADFKIEVLSLVVDLTNDEQIRTVPEQIKKEFSRLDILIHCAALVGTSALKGWALPFLEQSVDTWRLALEVNLTAVFSLTQACTPLLEKSGHGSIITIGSLYGVVGPDMRLYEGTNLGNPAAYSASKGGIVQFTRWLATTLAPNIRVNAISPGGVFRGHTEPFLSNYLKRVPLNRMATEEDLVGVAVYLASDLSAYVTGQNIMVDGGWTAW